MTRKKLYLLSLLSGIIFALSWPPNGFPFLLFIAFVPLLQIEHAFSSGQTSAKRTLLFGLSYLTFLIWNLASLWWIYNASFGGAIMAVLGNAFIMSAVFWIFHLTKKRLLTLNFKLQTLNFVFIIFWLAFEFCHYRWDLNWPWLTLGNAFAGNHTWIQWYEYTGTGGGSLWVLVVNLMIFNLIQDKEFTVQISKIKVAGILSVILIPIIISFSIYYSYNEKKNPVNVVVVQPNIDPYNEKFSGMSFEEQLDKMLTLAKQKIDSSTEYLVFPETALTEDIWENDLEQTASIKQLREFLKPFPKLKIITGASTYRLYKAGEKLSITARTFGRQEGYYDSYNTALQIDNSEKIQVYHKSKLVLGVEHMPYPTVLGFLDKFAIDLGGTTGSLGTQEERTVFKAPLQFPPSGGGLGVKVLPEGQAELASEANLGGASVAPVICYESVFGAFISEYIRNGASLIFIMTNDGWWGDTPGYKQHLIYGRLRAIETRRSIARSGNTGISCFINERGDILQSTEWWKKDVIKATINSNSGSTFYVLAGDVIGRVCFYISGIVLLFILISKYLLGKYKLRQ
ncbi:MAG: apolipoprotein N-acyltransferase [Bacteroidetes bacterium]|nr:apolipoprotein N-acyltransferase [Bacteroidota bacterium]